MESSGKHRRWHQRALAWGREEMVVLVTFGLLAGGAWAFMELADEVGEGSTEAVDRAVVLKLREPADLSDPVGPRWFEEMCRDFTALGSVGVLTLLTAGVVGWLALRGQSGSAVLVVVAVLGGLLLSSLLKDFFDRDRPSLVPHGTFVYTQSFPSGHAMLSATTYLVLGVMLAATERSHWLKMFYLGTAVFLMILVGFSRVYLGVHWPTDVLAGWTAGAVWALACWLAAGILRRRRWLPAPQRLEQEPGSAGN